eukprot:4573080-Pyramimonas_sp.AAC.1
MMRSGGKGEAGEICGIGIVGTVGQYMLAVRSDGRNTRTIGWRASMLAKRCLWGCERTRSGEEARRGVVRGRWVPGKSHHKPPLQVLQSSHRKPLQVAIAPQTSSTGSHHTASLL